jgi:hypothetical protein
MGASVEGWVMRWKIGIGVGESQRDSPIFLLATVRRDVIPSEHASRSRDRLMDSGRTVTDISREVGLKT